MFSSLHIILPSIVVLRSSSSSLDEHQTPCSLLYLLLRRLHLYKNHIFYFPHFFPYPSQSEGGPNLFRHCCKALSSSFKCLNLCESDLKSGTAGWGKGPSAMSHPQPLPRGAAIPNPCVVPISIPTWRAVIDPGWVSSQISQRSRAVPVLLCGYAGLAR